MQTGSLFGQYKILEKIGQRSSGDLYLAMEVAGFGYVTLLVLDENDPFFDERLPNFKGERSAGGRVVHNGVVKLLDSGKQGTRYYLAMEYVRGPIVEELIDKLVPLSDVERVSMAEQIVEAVLAAHGAGVTHGGLLPSVIYYTAEKQIKVGGFGCQTVPFNPPYGFVAPERVAGSSPSPEADLYSLAAVVLSLAIRNFIPSPCDEAAQSLSLRLKEDPVFSTLHPELKKVLSILFSDNPEDRSAGIMQILTVLKLPNIFRPHEEKRKPAPETTAEERPRVDESQTVQGVVEETEALRVAEEADSCYWRAQNAAFEKNAAQAMKEYRNILEMPRIHIGSLVHKVETETMLLYWNTGLKSGIPGTIPGADPQIEVDVDVYIEFLHHAIFVFKNLGRQAQRIVSERRLLETILVAVGDRARRDHLYREALMRCEDSVWVKREYCCFLAFEGKIKEAVTQRLRLAILLADEGLYSDALRELTEAKKLKADLRIPARLATIESKARKVELVSRGVLSMLDKAGSEAIHAAEHFLSRIPGNVDVFERLAAVKIEQGQRHEAIKLLSRAGAINYSRNAYDRALVSLGKILKINSEDLEALAYAVDILHRSGQRPEGKSITETSDNILSNRGTR